MTQERHEELLRSSSITISFPEDEPIKVDCCTSFTNEELENGVSDVVLEEVYTLAKITFEILLKQLKVNK
jgi:hypothetical protein